MRNSKTMENQAEISLIFILEPEPEPEHLVTSQRGNEDSVSFSS